ncbi:hypothetical protein [Mesoplasma corruscae]|uniref:Lipoprotein-associated type-17 domain-containing protein n=1 Tax=Mesoplasma corruscae TaxID=216874 RepID=A0A2S5RG63_9MOLU|nr:hypothetical protein [Mesoplasma corruscae]PPE06324.1 hypothetical protein MCORR_v1c06290 [Mesoplasma corruscae]
MNKLLLILGPLSVVSATSSVVIACLTNDGFKVKDISIIKRSLLIILQSRGETKEGWDNETLQQAVINAKLDEEDAISVQVSEVKSGTSTEFKQEINFKGNASRKNKFLYSGEIVLEYYFGENLPFKTAISQQDIDKSFLNMEHFLLNITFNNKTTVENTFKSYKNIPGAPVEGIIFGEVKNLKFEEQNVPSKVNSRLILVFSFEANAKLKNDQYYFEENISNNFKKFEGKLYAPITVKNETINKTFENIKNLDWKFSNIDELRNQIKNKIETISLEKGIKYNNYQIQNVLAENISQPKYWKANISLSLQPNEELGYKFENNATTNFELTVNLITLKNITNGTLNWTIFEQENGQMLINPQFIKFGPKIENNNFANLQGEKLLSDGETELWGKKENKEGKVNPQNQWEWINEKGYSFDKEAKKDFVEAMMKESKNSKYSVEQIIDDFMQYTTSFNYSKESFDFTKNDKALFFKEPSAQSSNRDQEIFYSNVLSKLGKKDLLENLKNNTTEIKKGTVLGKEYYTVLFLSCIDENNYKASDKAFRVILNNVSL